MIVENDVASGEVYYLEVLSNRIFLQLEIRQVIWLIRYHLQP